MKFPSQSSATFSFLVLLNRVPLGLLFLLAAIRKFTPWSQFGSNISRFARYAAGEAPLPEFLGLAYGYALPFVEALGGALLIVGLLGRISATVVALMLLSFLIAIGIEWWPEEGPAFSTNICLLTLSVFLIATGSGRYSLDALFFKTHRRSR